MLLMEPHSELLGKTPRELLEESSLGAARESWGAPTLVGFRAPRELLEEGPRQLKGERS